MIHHHKPSMFRIVLFAMVLSPHIVAQDWPATAVTTALKSIPFLIKLMLTMSVS